MAKLWCIYVVSMLYIFHFHIHFHNDYSNNLINTYMLLRFFFRVCPIISGFQPGVAFKIVA